MITTRAAIRTIAALALVTAIVLPRVPAAAHDGVPVTSAFQPVDPIRLADVRSGTGYTQLDAQTVRVAIPDETATAAVVRITLVSTGTGEFATAWPAGQPRPLVATTNADHVQPTSGASQIVRVGDDHSIDVFASKGSPVVVDLTGLFHPADAARAGRFVPIEPTRLFDTRDAGGPLGQGATITVPLPASVPADAVGLAVNLTAISASGGGFLTAYPAGAVRPVTSTVNWTGTGAVVASAAIVAVSPAGMSVYVNSSTDVVVDLQGWFTGPSSAKAWDGLYVPLETPVRRLDTRTLEGGGRIVYGTSAVEVGGFQGAAATGTVTITDPVTSGYFTLRPAGTPRQQVSNLNADTLFQTASNSFVSSVSTRGLAAYASAGGHVIIDQTGWFTGKPAMAASLPQVNNVAAPIPGLPSGPCDAEIGDLGLGSPFKATRYVIFGQSSAGQGLIAEHWGSDDGPQLMVVSLVHGDECPAARLPYSFRANPPQAYGVWIIDALNADGYSAGSRLTSNLVDLNRDGLAQTQPETRALMALTAAIQPVASLHAHAPYGEVLWWGPGYPSSSGSSLSLPVAARVSALSGGALRLAGAGSNPPSSAYLWQGQAASGGGQSVLIEFPPTSPNTAPQITERRAPESSVAQIDALVATIRLALAEQLGA